MTIELNGQPHEVDDGTSIAELIMSVTGSARGSAAVVDGEIVPRSSWASYELRDGQSVELITAIQGG
ncbi:MAG: thiamine biosynthesis protein ThiS [Jatrophihabitans sp.]|jgi:sulfur carrier protein|nr:thiamine biosynthesis protein ThiS [Jatrophihabitans sp.]MCW2657931.1 thiamine biosynthesis protein ThiS [Jatrophihabitans sp.]MDT4902366.1 sulfur carrier protein [Pseudonocardiales bacterium]MDT4930041.1 sulfur carrier protein [Pseudonocardiales bacterium]MDT4949700.1 sulfur carrier protein [Pseudonocardiales bacterium]